MNDVMKHRREILRLLANNKYEVMPNGGVLLLGGMNVVPMGNYDVEHRRYEATRRRAAMRRLSRLPLIGGQVKRWRGAAGDLLNRGLASNIIPTQGLNHLLETELGGGAQVNPWYMAIFENNATPAANWTAANFTSNSTESTAYDESTRVAYDPGAAAGGSMDNGAARAIFTINATKNIYGGGLLSDDDKSSTSGFLLSAARFASVRAVQDNDELAVKFTLTLTSTA